MRRTLAGRLVERFGQPDEMKELYAEGITGSLSKSLGALARRHPYRED